jgi:ankyrin repeat protein
VTAVGRTLRIIIAVTGALIVAAGPGCTASQHDPRPERPSADSGAIPESLSDAIERGDAPAVRTIVEADPEAVHRPIDGVFQPICLAVVGDQATVVDLLLDHGADIDAPDLLGQTPLLYAALMGHDALVELLLSRGADIDARNVVGLAPVHGAALCGHLDVMHRLHAAGADVGAADRRRATPLHYATMMGRADVVEALLELGADVRATTATGATPLHTASWNVDEARARVLDGFRLGMDGAAYAILRDSMNAILHAGDEHARIARLLLEHGAVVDARNAQRWTPLGEAAARGRHDLTEVLLEHGADWRVRDAAGFTPLHTAAEFGHLAVVEALAERGASLTSAVNDTRTPIHLAAQKGAGSVVAFLLRGGVDIESRERNGTTPLMMAGIGGSAAVATILLDAGADIEAVDTNGRTALMSPFVAVALRTRGVDPKNLATTATAAAVTRVLLERGADVTVVERPTGRSALHMACLGGATEGARVLLDHGADLDRVDGQDLTPLHLALLSGHPETAVALLDAGASPTTKGGPWKATPLHMAAAGAGAAVIERLLALGADLDATDARGLRPIDNARKTPDDDALMLLTAAGAVVATDDFAALDRGSRACVRAGAAFNVASRAGLEAACTELEHASGRAHATTLRCMDWVAQTYDATGDEHAAAEWRARRVAAESFDAGVADPAYLASASPEQMARDAFGADAEARRNGILALSQSTFGGRAPYLNLYLDSITADHPHDVRVAALRALARHGTVDALAGLRACVADRNPSIQKAAEVARLAIRLRVSSAR